MTSREFQDRLGRRAKRAGVNVPPKLASRLEIYFRLLETWNRKTNEGVTVTVPDEAQQAILFLAHETGGDFTTLKKAVRGRPGIFVRASQDLTEAGFEQARIEKYVASMREVPPSDPKALLDHSNLLARTLKPLAPRLVTAAPSPYRNAYAYPPLTFPGAREEMPVSACDLTCDPEAPAAFRYEGPFADAMARRLSSPDRPLSLIAGGGDRWVALDASWRGL